jgi:hypothetical protein
MALVFSTSRDQRNFAKKSRNLGITLQEYRSLPNKLLVITFKLFDFAANYPRSPINWFKNQAILGLIKQMKAIRNLIIYESPSV